MNIWIMKSVRKLLLTLFLMPLMSFAQPAWLNDGLVAYYPFDGDAKDASGNGNDFSPLNGITYDFLFSIAKELADKDSMVMMAAGPKGNEPLVFNDGGKPYRAFLEGRIKNDKYCLLLHLTDLELKSISKNTK